MEKYCRAGKAFSVRGAWITRYHALRRRKVHVYCYGLQLWLWEYKKKRHKHLTFHGFSTCYNYELKTPSFVNQNCLANCVRVTKHVIAGTACGSTLLYIWCVQFLVCLTFLDWIYYFLYRAHREAIHYIVSRFYCHLLSSPKNLRITWIAIVHWMWFRRD